jgi:hypothetical protein
VGTRPLCTKAAGESILDKVININSLSESGPGSTRFSIGVGIGIGIGVEKLDNDSDTDPDSKFCCGVPNNAATSRSSQG